MNKRMGNLSLRPFSTTSSPTINSEPMVSTAPPQAPAPERETPANSVQVVSKEPPKEKTVTMNIKIPADLHEWLTETAKTVRENNTESVPAGERVFPQHLIVAAVRLLQSGNADWSQVKTVQDLDRV